MIELDGTLSDLARLRSGSEPIVSLYLDVHWKDEKTREQVRLFVQERMRKERAHYLDDSPGREGLERSFDRIERYVSDLANQTFEVEKNGLALFACGSLNLWRTYFFRRPFQNELCLDAIPHLTQLARLADDFEPAILVVPLQDGADIYQVSLGELASESSLRGFVPRVGNKEMSNAGAGAPRREFERLHNDERHQENFIHKNRRAAAVQVTKLFDDKPGSHLVLVGISSSVSAFERELPERVREAVIARIPRPREWESSEGLRRDGVVAGAGKAIAEHEKRSEERIVDAVVGESLRGALGVLGTNDVVEAVNQGRVHRLVIEEDFRRTGWRCDNCGALGDNAEAAESCVYCGREIRAIGHLGEALVARALGMGAEVEVVAHTNKLHSYRGVGAFLRQTAPTGMRGSSLPWPTSPGANR